MKILSRKVIVNLIVSLIIFPLFFQIKYWIDFKINPFNEYSSFREFFESSDFGISDYFFTSMVSLILLLLPFQLIKDYCFKRGRKLQFVKKVTIFSVLVLIVIALLGSFSNIWMIPFLKNLLYVLWAFLIGALFTTILYFTIDKYVEKRKIDFEEE